MEEVAEKTFKDPPPRETWRPVGSDNIPLQSWRKDETPSAKPLKPSADVAGARTGKMVRMVANSPETLDKELGRTAQRKEGPSLLDKKSLPTGRQFRKHTDMSQTWGTSESETVDSDGERPSARHDCEGEMSEEAIASEVFTPQPGQIEGKQRDPGLLASILEEEAIFLVSPEWKIYEKAMLICGCWGLNSPKMNCHLYDAARAIVLETMEDLGHEDLSKRNTVFYGMFKKQLMSLIDMQLSHQIASLLPIAKPRICEPEHQPSLVDATTTSRLGMDIVIPSEAKPPLTLRDNQPDPNMEEVIAGLDAPQQPGESTQAYEQ